MQSSDLFLYFIMGSTNVVNRDPLEVLDQALQDGITMFQYREKGNGCLVGVEYRRLAIECQSLCAKYNVPFIVNDDVELALDIDADGVHVGQEDGDLFAIRERIGSKILGISVHDQNELLIAMQANADYIGVGPIFPTKSKADATLPIGTEFLKFIHAKFPELPTVAIGGINLLNMQEIFQAGTHGISVISAICEDREFVTKMKQIHRTFG